MAKSMRQEKFLELRRSFPYFIYERYDYSLTESGLLIRFTFNLADQYHFHPELFFPRKSWFLPDDLILRHLPAIAFNTGMAEMISYWKAACPPRILVKPHTLNKDQVEWWRRLWFHGLGEFFYLNGISIEESQLFTMEVADQDAPAVGFPMGDGGVLIPVGGGKDSAVTMELLGKERGNRPFILNPRGATLETIRVAGIGRMDLVEATRTIDPTLLTLNGEGFLNGHTPFSALLAFVATIGALLSGKSYIALSNESSANESTIAGTLVNHQYSKSFRFESDFRDYLSRYIAPQVEYLSFLRPLSELQIAALFARLPAYHPVFKSCNAGSKEDVWCGKCAKCMFTWIILSPFLTVDALVSIFGKNLLEDVNLIPIFDQLTGVAPEKPFDCVGTVDEVNVAIQETIRQYGGRELPPLLRHYREFASTVADSGDGFHQTMRRYDTYNHLPEKFGELLKHGLYA